MFTYENEKKGNLLIFVNFLKTFLKENSVKILHSNNFQSIFLESLRMPIYEDIVVKSDFQTLSNIFKKIFRKKLSKNVK